MRFSVAINIMPRSEISDPQGQTIERALPGLGFQEITSVRVGKRITLMVEAPDDAAGEAIITKACDTFLTNPIIEDYEFRLVARSGDGRTDIDTGGDF